MTGEKNGIEWNEIKDNTKNGIEWNEIKDNLRIIEVDENPFIDLGNPFQRERPIMPPPMPTAPRTREIHRRSLISMMYVVFLVALIFLAGFFYCRGEYIEYTAELSGSLDVEYLAEMYPSTGNTQYKLFISASRPDFRGTIGIKIDGTRIGEISTDTPKIPYRILSGCKILKIVFYRHSLLFGERIIRSEEIFIPEFSLDARGTEIRMTSSTPYEFSVYSMNLKHGRIQIDPLHVLIKSGKDFMFIIETENKNELKLIVRR